MNAIASFGEYIDTHPWAWVLAVVVVAMIVVACDGDAP
jgi:hypothetical protein